MSKLEFQTVEEAVKFIEDLQNTHKSELEAANKEIEGLKTANTNALDEVTELSSLLAAQEQADEDGSCIVTIDKKRYKLLGKKFVIPGKGEISVKDLQKDQKELKRMVKIGSGSLIPIEI